MHCAASIPDLGAPDGPDDHSISINYMIQCNRCCTDSEFGRRDHLRIADPDSSSNGGVDCKTYLKPPQKARHQFVYFQ